MAVWDPDDENYDPWAEHPNYPRKDWKYEVDNDDTVLGYTAWWQTEFESDQDDSDDSDDEETGFDGELDADFGDEDDEDDDPGARPVGA